MSSNRRLTVPFFPRPPREYDQNYFAEIVRSFSNFLRQSQNPGDGRFTEITLTDLPTSDTGLRDGDVYVTDSGELALKGTPVYSAATTGLYYVRDEKASGTDGGSSSADTTSTRTLNTEKVTNITGASLSSNQVTLPAGSYWMEGSAPGRRVGKHKALIYNVTDSSVALVGTSGQNPGNGYISNMSFVRGLVTITSQKVFELRHYTALAAAGTGFGQSTGMGEVEVYSELLIRRVA